MTDKKDNQWLDGESNCCAGDVIKFKEDVLERVRINHFGKLAWRPAGSRVITAEIIRESYGTEKQQHTYTLRVISVEGYRADEVVGREKLLRKGHNIYRNGIDRLEGVDDGTRRTVLEEKNGRGADARAERNYRRDFCSQ